MARRVTGGAKIKALLRGAPAEIRKELADVLARGGNALQFLMKRRAPSRTGKLRAGISFQVWPRSLVMKVGLLKTKAGRSELFYGRIQDLGRKAQTRTVRRANARPYVMRVRGMAGKRFVTGRFPELRAAIQERTRGLFRRALSRISGG